MTADGAAGTEFRLDHDRQARIGLAEAVLCKGKSVAQINGIMAELHIRESSMLLTRLGPRKHARLSPDFADETDYDPVSRTAFFRRPECAPRSGLVAIVAAGTSDARVAREAARTLEFSGISPTLIFDVGVAGLWRLQERLDDIGRHPVVIVAAGMDAALISVLGGLVMGQVIALPVSTGYGAARRGETALAASLASCASGIVAVNIDNGYGAACAAMRTLAAAKAIGAAPTGG